ncbi:hypothetical protein L9F63_025702, partial [Diploptera punctata]
LTVCDFYLWGSLKDKVYKTNPHTLEELKNNIRNEIRNLTVPELQRVNLNVFTRYHACLTAGGQHFQHFL